MSEISDSIDNRMKWIDLLKGDTANAKDCPWEIFLPCDWGRILEISPDFLEHCPWREFNAHDWADVVMDTDVLDDQCPWDELDGHAWTMILHKRPELISRCNVGHLRTHEKVMLACELKDFRLEDYVDLHELESRDWGWLIRCRPEYADICPWGDLEGGDLENIYFNQPQLAEKHGFRQFSISDWAMFLRVNRDYDAVIMPKSVIYIGHRAFSGCKALTTVEIPWNLTDIVWWTFRDCHALASVTIPESVTNVDYTAFLNTGALTSFCVEEGNRYYKSVNGLLLTKNGTKLVHGANGDVTIPFGVTDIGSLAFDGCSALRSIAIPSGVRDIGYHAFSACCGLTAVTMPSTVTQIGYGAFGNCAALISVALSSSVTNVGDGAFRNCAELSAVTVPSSVTNIGRKVFENCSKLKSVCVPRGVNTETLSFDEWNKRVHWRWQKTIDGCVWSYHPVNGEAKIVDTAHWIPGPRCAVSPRPIGAVAIPSTIDGLPVTGIGGCALADCSGLTSVVIPLSVKTVQRRAFENCTALTSVTLPATVTNIDEEVFGNCSQLKSVNVLKDGKSETVSLEDFCKRWKLKRPRIPERSFRTVRRLGNTRPVPASATQRRESVKSE